MHLGLVGVASRGRLLLACVAFWSLLFAGMASTAFGGDSHTFDPILSLTGGCKTSEVDPIPDPSCPEELGRPFSSPRSVTTDSYGSIYVASFGSEMEHGAEGRIDVFDADGFFLTEIEDSSGPKNLAVDSKGNLYVFNYRSIGANIEEVVKYSPTVYNPEAGEIEYGKPPVRIGEGLYASVTGIAVNRLNDHLFVHFGPHVTEYSSAAEESKVLDETIGKGILRVDAPAMGLAVDASQGRIYATDYRTSPEGPVLRVLELPSPHGLLQTIDGSTTPAGKFAGEKLSVAVDEDTGHVFVYDELAKVVYEFTKEGQYISTIEHSFQPVFGAEIGIDNGPKSPNGALDPVGRHLYVPSGTTGVGHSYAFGPQPPPGPPVVESVSFSEVTQTEAELHATVNPDGLPTKYVFEYTTLENFEAEEFSSAQVVGAGELSGGNLGLEVSASAVGLSPGTSYLFRVIATNEKGPDEGKESFTTFMEPGLAPECPNNALRTGLSALLPDCRAYELVTPANTNSRTPTGVWHLGTFFATREASPSGEKVSFRVEGGSLPGFEGTGSLAGDPYLATRGPSGWTTSAAGPDGTESQAPLLGSTSPDQGFSFWGSGASGSASVEDKETTYVRYPDGHSALIGRGSIADDPRAEGKLISENGSHITFVSGGIVGTTAVQLEPNAPPSGTRAIYDRTPDEVTHVVSLLPGDVTPAAGQNAFYEGASLDGKGVAFRLGGGTAASPLFFRYNNQETYEVAEEGTFAGIPAGGKRVFYLREGDLYAFNVETEEATRFTESGDVAVVNVSADGSAAYIVSPGVLTKEANPNGAVAKVGEENLYLSREGDISFVGILVKQDVEEEGGIGLETWVPHVASFGETGEDPSRSTPDGSALLFESRAALDGYDPEGHVEVYRYDSVDEELDCLSCNPTEAPATGRASLESISIFVDDPRPFSAFGFVANLRPDGRRAFFQSTEALVPGDTDGLQDVYEWEAPGVGGCERTEGCVYLISSGQSARTDYIYSVSDSGDDVFFRTSDLLLPSDNDETPSIYDARVGGGFPEGAEEACEAEGCRGGLIPGPSLSTPAVPAIGADDNVPGTKKCPSGKHRVKRDGRTRCVKNHHKRRHRKAGSKKRGESK